MTAPSLTPSQVRAVWRQRFPEALVCTMCGRLLATERARFARLTAAAVAAYVCAECRWEAAEERSASVLPRRSTRAIRETWRPEAGNVPGGGLLTLRTASSPERTAGRDA